MSIFDAVTRGVETGVRAGLSEAVPNIVDAVFSALFSHRSYPVTAGCQLRLMEAGMEPVKAWAYARQLVADHCKETRAQIGHPDFTWDCESGRQIAEEDIRHWEKPA